MATISVKKIVESEDTIEVPVPSYWKKTSFNGHDVMGVLTETRTVSICYWPDYSSLRITENKNELDGIAKGEYEQISKEDFDALLELHNELVAATFDTSWANTQA